MGKNIAVLGCALDCPFAKIVGPPSADVMASNKGCYSGPVQVMITAYAGKIIDVPGSGMGQGVFTPTATAVMIDGKPALLEGDKAIVTVNGLKNAGNSQVPAVEVVTVTITSAGQVMAQGS